MTKPMTVEELRDKARLTDEEIKKILDRYWVKPYVSERHRDIIKAQVDKALQAFIQFCEENNIKQVVEGELPEYWFDEEKNRDAPDPSLASYKTIGDEVRKDMLKHFKQSLKSVKEVFG